MVDDTERRGYMIQEEEMDINRRKGQMDGNRRLRSLICHDALVMIIV